MKKIMMANLTVAPVPPAEPTHASAAFEKDDGGVPLPPAPPQLNAPVGPPPPEVVLPTTFEGYIELAKKVSRGEMTDKALIWVGMGQAEATNRIANALEELLGFLNPSQDESGEEHPSGLAAAIADGILMADEEKKPVKAAKNGK